jgi:hypothetical protein
MKVTPSRQLTREQAARVKSFTTKSGGLRFEVHDKLGALAHLARILGLATSEAAPGSTNITNNTQVNVVGTANEPAIDAVKRRAFALEKAARAEPMLDVTPSDRPKEGSK